MAKMAIAFNYITKIITIIYFAYTIIRDKKLITTRTLIFKFATILYCLIYAIDLLHLSPGHVILSSLLFNILSSGIMLVSPEKMYKRDVLPVVNNLVIENLGSPVLAVDENNRILFMNSKATKIVQREVKFLQNGLEEVFEPLTNYLIREKDEGDYFIYLDKVYDVKYYNIEDWREETKTRIYVLVDVSELVNYSRNLEMTVVEKTKQLVESEKLAAIGTMTSMVGHDLRNPLQVLKFICEEMSKELGDHPKFSVYIQKANKNVIYMDKIVSDLQFVLQNKELSKVEVNLGEMIADAFESVNVPENVQVDSSVGAVYVYVDPVSFVRVLVNLVNNAVQAMPKSGGKVWVEYSNESGFDCIAIRDSGVGISSENMEKIFSAFYTTKAKGMGLGLIVCKHIVEAHDGNVSVYSEEGVGTCFKVRIPSKNVVNELDVSVDQIIQEINM